MPLPDVLHEALAAARFMIRRAHAIDVGVQTGNAKAILSNAQAFVAHGPEISEAFEAARQQIAAMEQARALEGARTAALHAVDALEQSLLQARPNEQAKALGIDWL